MEQILVDGGNTSILINISFFQNNENWYNLLYLFKFLGTLLKIL